MDSKKLIQAASFMILFVATGLFALEPDDCLLYAPFDGSADAFIAKGSQEAAVEGELKFTPGMRGKAIVIGNYEGKDCGPVSFETKDNAYARVGSVAFWAKCIGEPYFFKNKGYFTFFSVNVKGYNLSFRDTIDSTGFIVSGSGRYFKTSIWICWEADAWNHVAFTWSPEEHRLYVGGQLYGTTTEGIFPFSDIGETFTIGSKSKSAIAVDDFYVFGRPLTSSEVKALYLFGQGSVPAIEDKRNMTEPQALEAVRKGPASSAVAVSRARTAPKIDGRPTENVWRTAARFTGLTDEITGTVAADGPVITMTYDKENIYIAAEYAIPEVVRQSPALFPNGPLKRTVKEKDGPVANDDNFEVVLSDSQGRLCRFFISAGGMLRDEREGDASWDSGFVAKTYDDENKWTVEYAIPLNGLAVVPKDGTELGFNISQTLRVLKDTRMTWYTDKGGGGFAKLTLAGRSPVFRYESASDPNKGEFYGTLTVVNTTRSDVSIKARGKIGKKESKGTFGVDAQSSRTITSEKTFPDELTSKIELYFAHGDTVLFKANIPFSFAPLLEVEKYFAPFAKKLTVTVNRSALDWKNVSAVVGVYKKGAKKPAVEASIDKFTRLKEEVSLEVSRLGAGNYVIKTAFSGDGKTTVKKIPFEIRRKPWWKDNKVGISNKVPPPFTPVETEGLKVSMWGRTYDYRDALFARQYRTQGKTLLARPVSLVISADGKEVRLADGETKLTSKSQIGAELVSSAEGPGLSVKTKTRVEYDGFTWIEMTITPKEKASVDAMYLEVPMVKELARLMYTGSYGGRNCGNIPEEGFKGAGINGHWFGWAGGGIQFSNQHTHNWHNKGKSLGQIIRLEDATAYRMNFIDNTVALDKPLTIAFGIQVTPTKRKYGDWRGWWIEYNKHRLGTHGIALWNTHWSIGVNYPVLASKSDPRYRYKKELGHLSKEGWIRDAGGTWRTWKQVRQLKEKENISSIMYVQGGFTWPYSPEYQYYQEDWRSVPTPRFALKPGGELKWWGGQAPVCVNSSFTDFYVANLRKSVAREKIHGLYFDCWLSRQCASEAHGCGYVDENGERHPWFPLLGQREFYKRVYVIMKQHDPNSIISYHMSGQPHMALCSFSDLMATGEQYATGLSRRVAAGEAGNYYEILSLDHTQAEFMGHNWGPMQTFLTEFSAAEPGESYPNRKNPFGAKYFRDERLTEIYHVAGIFALHDQILPWAFRVNIMPFIRTRQAMETLGLDETVEYVPYWDNEKFVKLYVGQGEKGNLAFEQVNKGSVYSDQQIVCAVYRKATRALFVVMNNSDEDEQHIKLLIDYDALGFRPEMEPRMDDALTGAMYGYQGEEDAVIFPLKARSFRLLTTYSAY